MVSRARRDIADGALSQQIVQWIKEEILIRKFPNLSEEELQAACNEKTPLSEARLVTKSVALGEAKDKSPGSGGTATLFVAGKETGSVAVAKRVPFRNSATETFDVGLDCGSAVSGNYTIPFAFSGTLHWLRFEYIE